jgi:hypothetical protein
MSRSSLRRSSEISSLSSIIEAGNSQTNLRSSSGNREKSSRKFCRAKFIEAAWGTHEYKFECFATFLARTEAVKACAGHPDFYKGHGNDDALLLKLCLHHGVVFSDRCTFRFRSYESSHGLASSILDLAQAYREFFSFLIRIRSFKTSGLYGQPNGNT